MQILNVNRFPKMVVLQKERALRLGFSEEKAKIIGYAEAKKYAIFKNCRKGKKKISTKVFPKDIAPSSNQQEKPKEIKEFRLILTPEGLPVVGKQVVSIKDYEIYMSRFNQKEIEAMEKWANSILEKTNERDLKVESRFFNNVWKLHRDDEIYLDENTK